MRTLILGNGVTASGQNNQEAPRGNQQQGQRGRGRFPGGFPKGRGRGRGRGANQTPTTGAPTETPTSPGLREGNPTTPSQRGNRSRQPKSQSQPQSPSQNEAAAGGVQATQLTPTKRYNLRHKSPQQAQHQNQLSPAGQPSPKPYTPTVIQRPINNTSPRNAPFVSPTPHAQHLPAFQAHPHHISQPNVNPMAQADYLDRLAAHEIPKVEIKQEESDEKKAFMKYLDGICKAALAQNYSGDIGTIDLVGFGSLASGFAMPGSDMDLAIVPLWKDAANALKTEIDRDIPRLLERAILNEKMGARLLTRTRVPIIKVCQRPTEELYMALCEERKKWDELPEEEQYPSSLPAPDPTAQSQSLLKPLPGTDTTPQVKIDGSKEAKPNSQKPNEPNKGSSPPSTATSETTTEGTNNAKEQKPYHDRPWAREKILGPLDFPKIGVGTQCDINFENPLGLHNTKLLYCYSLCDPRVRPIVLFVKAWAKRRKINSSYSGTLSSYGWVLMVLHYLVNIAQPPVCPNLQHFRPSPINAGVPQKELEEVVIQGYTVRFWRNEAEIIEAAKMGKLSYNRESIGTLLRGFFQYFASLSNRYYGSRKPSFFWTTEVLSLRTPGGLRTKQDKGWTGAKTTISNGKEVRNRYLFAIEDPFELDHNVARTVTHNGIVAIRDEFRRAWRILNAVGRGLRPEDGGLFDEVVEPPPPPPTPQGPDGNKPKTGGEPEGVAAVNVGV